MILIGSTDRERQSSRHLRSHQRNSNNGSQTRYHLQRPTYTTEKKLPLSRIWQENGLTCEDNGDDAPGNDKIRKLGFSQKGRKW